MPVEVRDLSHVYNEDSPFSAAALKGVSLTIADGEFLAVIGHTGSGKSTLIQHLNGLIRPTGGTVVVDGQGHEPARGAPARGARVPIPGVSAL